MKKILALILLFLLFNFCAIQQPAHAKNSDELNKIELQIYGYNYDNNTDTQRLERLENYAYGGVKSGTIEKRLANLKKDLSIDDTKLTENKTKNTPSNNYYDYDDYDYYDNSTLASDPSAQYPVVDVLEEKIFNKANTHEDIYSRISKLEKQIFKKETPEMSLSDRVDKLRTAIITDVAIAGYDENGDMTITPTYRQLNPGYGYNPAPQDAYSQSNFFTQGSLYNEVSILERDYFKTTNPAQPIEERLTKLEKKILKKSYPNDDNVTRLERISAAADAQKSAGHFSGSKFERNLATGMQIAGFILMILAFVL